MTTKRAPRKPKKPKKTLAVKRLVKLRVPIERLEPEVTQALVDAHPKSTRAELVIVDPTGVPVVELPLPPSEWRRIWNVLVKQLKGVMP